MKLPFYVPALVSIIALVVVFGDRIPSLDWISQKPDTVTYVFEKSDSPMPSYVTTAFNKLNRSGIVATYYEKDTKDGSDETPEQYKVPLEAAQSAGMPALVVLAYDKVVRVVKEPKTEQEILEAAK